MRTAPANGTIIRRQRAVVARDSIFVNILHYASSSIFQKLLGVFTALARPKLLSPELFGLWSVLNVLPNYASYLHLGSRSSMRFLIPVYETRGEEEKISATKAAVYRGTLLPTLLFALVLLLSALFLDLQIEMRIGLSVSVPRKMLATSQNAIILHTFHIGKSFRSYIVPVFSE